MNLIENNNIIPLQLRLIDSEKYEVIENKRVSNASLKNLTIAGALFSFTEFSNVTFKNCVFFGSRIENCNFTGCKFNNCTFQFTETVNCTVTETQLLDTRWFSSPSRNCIYEDCYMDRKTTYYITGSTGQNKKQLIAA